ncbi:metalloregulator ArsR/SmtB family transcription factor [Salipaludibacillus sp. CUR1]|uniref:ArsR/SmtB family transcription factor n=1 Tax=Salipaludibacillus sp. CUR1 TaxID=2820003 RepID=UPI001E32050E|nr:metalloregulator ArsR/SmtB family transcription factor [Salipaludibacillus sp. CUR1]MCE7793199.1 metalloregulator ArsR/SmtB family transcription factor [Salipaludibacillus sp. CUR1]
MAKKEWIILNKEESKELFNEAQEKFPHLKTDEEIEAKAALFKALGDETRLKIVSLLAVRECCLCELVEALGSVNSTVTHHLKLLERGGVIQSRREGKFTIYKLNPSVKSLDVLLGGGD